MRTSSTAEVIWDRIRAVALGVALVVVVICGLMSYITIDVPSAPTAVIVVVTATIPVQAIEQVRPPTSTPASQGCPHGCTRSFPGCEIKGDIDWSTGEKIYYVPGDALYDYTEIETQPGERWFCSEAVARENGWRASRVHVP